MSKVFGLDCGETHQSAFTSKGFENKFVFDIMYDMGSNQWV